MIVNIHNSQPHWGSCPINRLLVSLPLVRRLKMNDNPTSLGVTYGQHVESPSRCWFSRSVLTIQLSSCSMLHNSGLAPMLYTDRKFLATKDQTNAEARDTSSKHICLKPRGHGPRHTLQIQFCNLMTHWISKNVIISSLLTRGATALRGPRLRKRLPTSCSHVGRYPANVELTCD